MPRYNQFYACCAIPDTHPTHLNGHNYVQACLMVVDKYLLILSVSISPAGLSQGIPAGTHTHSTAALSGQTIDNNFFL